MSSKLKACAVRTLMVMVLMVVTSAMPFSPEHEEGIYNVVYLGTVEGKSYFYEQIWRNWTEGEKMCNSSGMQMATIKSQAQAIFLSNSNATLGASSFWVAAMETQKLSRYEWKDDGEGLNESPVPLSQEGLPPVEQCLTYISTRAEYFARDCSVPNTFTLCEINN